MKPAAEGLDLLHHAIKAKGAEIIKKWDKSTLVVPDNLFHYVPMARTSTVEEVGKKNWYFSTVFKLV